MTVWPWIWICRRFVTCRGGARPPRFTAVRQWKDDHGAVGRWADMRRTKPALISEAEGRDRGSPMMIRTPDQRVRVFVSSTLGELAAEGGGGAAGLTPPRV